MGAEMIPLEAERAEADQNSAPLSIPSLHDHQSIIFVFLVAVSNDYSHTRLGNVRNSVETPPFAWLRIVSQADLQQKVTDSDRIYAAPARPSTFGVSASAFSHGLLPDTSKWREVALAGPGALFPEVGSAV
jgi:hypothetical protein